MAGGGRHVPIYIVVHTHTHSLVKKQAMEVQQPDASTWEAKKNRHLECDMHTQLSQEAGKGGSTARC